MPDNFEETDDDEDFGMDPRMIQITVKLGGLHNVTLDSVVEAGDSEASTGKNITARVRKMISAVPVEQLREMDYEYYKKIPEAAAVQASMENARSASPKRKTKEDG